MSWTTRIGVVLGALALVFAGCGDSGDDGSDYGNGNGSGSGSGSGNGSADFGEWDDCSDYDPVETVSVGGGDNGLAFEPKQVTVSTGDVVQFTWEGGNHSVTGDKSTNWSEDLEGACGTDDTAWFDSGAKEEGEYCVQFNKAGEFWYQCTVMQHCENGMWGKVTVEE